MFWLVDAVRPRRFVELGCYSGYSYFVACQAVRRLGLGTACHAVGTWEGDEHSDFYGEDVLRAVSAHNQANYAAFSQLVRSTCENALQYFAEDSVDLLHVDGRHLHEDVASGFKSWQSRLTEDAIVLIHGTDVRERNFGVWKFFEDLCRKYPAFEFKHGHGLGIAALGQVPAALEPLFGADDVTARQVRLMYAALGEGVAQRWLLSELRAEVSRIAQVHRSEVDAPTAAPTRRTEAARAEVEARQSETEALQVVTEQLRTLSLARRSEAEALQFEVAELRRLEAARRSEAEAAAAALERARAAHEAQANALARKVERLLEEKSQSISQLSEARSEAERLRAEYTRITNSLSWHLAMRARDAFARNPRMARRALTLMRAGWWVATLRFGRLRDGVRSWGRIRADEALLAASGMFDETFYLQTYPDVAQSGWSPLRHYLLFGGFEGRRPHPLFDGRWYLATNPDVRAQGINPLVHFVRNGLREGRNPNPYFDLAWYRGRIPDDATSAMNPVLHYMEIGADQFLDPSPNFNTQWYLKEYADVTAAGQNPLAHFLLIGQAEGRHGTDAFPVDFSDAEPVSRARIECLKEPAPQPELALFVTHSPVGRLKSHVRGYLEALRREGIVVVLIVAADAPFIEDEPWLRDLVDGLFVRENGGFDFAAWAHVLRLHPELYRAEALYWLNDSVIGPTSAEVFHALIERVRQHPAHLVGLTANYDRRWHVQSYFLALKKPLLECPALHRFVLDIVSFRDKDQVINAYEIRFAQAMQAAGLSVGVVFPEMSVHDPTVYEWRRLIEEGFPFIKVLAITNDIRSIDKSDWREVLARNGYDVAVADRVLLERLEVPPTPVETPPVPWRIEPRPDRPPRVAFIAPWSFSGELGVAARGYASAFMHTRLAVNFLPVRRASHVHQRVAPTLGQYGFVGPADLAVVHLNPDAWSHLLTPDQWEVIASAARRVGIFAWESHILPPGFAERMAEVDAVWTPSRYCAAGFRRATDTPIEVVPHPVPPKWPRLTPEGAAEHKRSLGLDPSGRVILSGFGASSHHVQKNPLALVRAFAATRLADAGWSLVLKARYLARDSADDARLRQCIEETPGTLLIERAMGSDELDALMEVAEIYASPHSSGGFDLTIEEAMSLGKLVVATDYGGSRDFLDADTGYPVRCSEYRTAQDEGTYPAGMIWARVDESHLAESLLAAASLNPSERAALGARAHRRIVDLLSPEAVAREIGASVARLLAGRPAHAAPPQGG